MRYANFLGLELLFWLAYKTGFKKGSKSGILYIFKAGPGPHSIVLIQQ